MMNHKIYGSYIFWSLNRFKSLQWPLAAFGGGLYRLEHCALTHKNLRSLSLRPPFVTLRLKEEEQGRSLEYLSIFVSMQCSQLWLNFRNGLNLQLFSSNLFRDKLWNQWNTFINWTSIQFSKEALHTPSKTFFTF